MCGGLAGSRRWWWERLRTWHLHASAALVTAMQSTHHQE